MNDLVPPFLSNYFIRNHTIHTYATSQRNDIHLPNPKFNVGEKYIQIFSAVVLNDLPTPANTTRSSPNTAQSIPFQLVQFTSFQWSLVHCAFSPKLSVQFHAAQYGPVQSAPFLSKWSSPSSQDKC
ncbi:hypothetical protein pdam_00022143 [Pocillopora damicornis]|uniref:Uncharacterized protein n=1 Tax=Pocillopora damicornis TaxID=46731 RepID=A0A3M6UI13_POCDA|nr:hypothetical protein pdam_00022143 [Pocillopora damicornis]